MFVVGTVKYVDHCSTSLTCTIWHHKNWFEMIWYSGGLFTIFYVWDCSHPRMHRQFDEVLYLRELLSWQGLSVSCWAHWSQPSCRISWGLHGPWPQDGPLLFRIFRIMPVKSEHTKILVKKVMTNRQNIYEYIWTSCSFLHAVMPLSLCWCVSLCILFRYLPTYNSVVKLQVSPSIASIHRDPITLYHSNKETKAILSEVIELDVDRNKWHIGYFVNFICLTNFL